MKKSKLFSFIEKNTNDVSSGGINYSTVNSKEKKKLPILGIGFIMLVTIMLAFVIFSFVQVEQLKTDVKKIQKNISSIQSSIDDTQRDIDEKYKNVNFGEEASNLGMTDGKYLRYIPNDSSDVSMVVYSAGESEATTLFSIISRNFNKVINFLN